MNPSNQPAQLPIDAPEVPETVTIDGTEYSIKKLKFKEQMQLASTIFKLIPINQTIDPDKPDEAQDKKIKVNVSEIISRSPDVIIDILAISLGQERAVVENFENHKEVLTALGKVLEVNKVNGLMQDFLPHLTSIMSTF